MSKAVVYFLESVEVKHYQAQWGAVGLSVSIPDGPLEVPMVGQTGQPIGCRLGARVQELPVSLPQLFVRRLKLLRSFADLHLQGLVQRLDALVFVGEQLVKPSQLILGQVSLAIELLD